MEDQVPEQIKRERASILEAEGKRISDELTEQYITDHGESTGRPVHVLIEKNVGKDSSGHSEHFVEVKIKNCSSPVGSVVAAYLDGRDGKFVTGKMA